MAAVLRLANVSTFSKVINFSLTYPEYVTTLAFPSYVIRCLVQTRPREVVNLSPVLLRHYVNCV